MRRTDATRVGARLPFRREGGGAIQGVHPGNRPSVGAAPRRREEDGKLRAVFGVLSERPPAGT